MFFSKAKTFTAAIYSIKLRGTVRNKATGSWIWKLLRQKLDELTLGFILEVRSTNRKQPLLVHQRINTNCIPIK